MSLSLSHGKPLDVGHHGLDQAQLPPVERGPIDLNRWFATGKKNTPLELEIGSGKGTFLVQQATRTPHVNYIGVEYARPFWRYAADRCRRHGLENVRVVHIDAESFLRHQVPDLCLQRVHLYFPDPWPKTRHHKRRLVRESFLRMTGEKLAPLGQMRIATDHAAYFQWMGEQARCVEDLFERLPFPKPETADRDGLVGTNFERKYRREGRPCYAMMLRRYPP